MSMQGVHRDIHGPEEGPDILAIHISHRVPLDQATGSTIQPFKRRINLDQQKIQMIIRRRNIKTPKCS